MGRVSAAKVSAVALKHPSPMAKANAVKGSVARASAVA